MKSPGIGSYDIDVKSNNIRGKYILSQYKSTLGRTFSG